MPATSTPTPRKGFQAGAPRESPMQTNPRECMFCHGDLPVRPDEPANLAFLAHLESQDPCRKEFDVWTSHMQKDYLGY